MKTIFFTVATTDFQNRWQNSHKVDFIGFMNSFKKFHPECELLVFNEHDLKLCNVNLLNAKARFGFMLKKQSPDANICNLDCDHYIFARLDEILKADYDLACPENYNITGNVVGIKVLSGLRGEGHPFQKDGQPIQETAPWLVSDKEFLQGGLIASPSLQFWEHYEYATRKHWNKFNCYENDVLNIVAYTYPYKIKVLDRDENNIRQSWYGCSIIGKEKYCYVKDEQIMLEGSPVKAFHFAHGAGKKKYDEIFTPEVARFIETIIN